LKTGSRRQEAGGRWHEQEAGAVGKEQKNIFHFSFIKSHFPFQTNDDYQDERVPMKNDR
jgi:hypothetical protein